MAAWRKYHTGATVAFYQGSDWGVRVKNHVWHVFKFSSGLAAKLLFTKRSAAKLTSLCNVKNGRESTSSRLFTANQTQEGKEVELLFSVYPKFTEETVAVCTVQFSHENELNKKYIYILITIEFREKTTE